MQFSSGMNCIVDAGGRAVEGVVLRPFACWDCGFDPAGSIIVSLVFCKVETSAIGRSLLQRNPTWYVCQILCELEPHQ
jgi:hypothetical protein